MMNGSAHLITSGTFSLPWLLAIPISRRTTEITKECIYSYCIPNACKDLIRQIPSQSDKCNGANKMTLYVVSNLLYGVTLILERKTIHLEEDAQNLKDSLIRIKDFEKIKLTIVDSLTDISSQKKRKRRSRKESGDNILDISLNGNFEMIPLPMLDISKARCNLGNITLNEVQYKKKSIFNDLDELLPGDEIIANDWNVNFQKELCKKSTSSRNNPSAVQLLRDEVSLFDANQLENSVSAFPSHLSQPTLQSLNEIVPIEISLSPKRILHNEMSLDIDVPVNQMEIGSPIVNNAQLVNESNLNENPSANQNNPLPFPVETPTRRRSKTSDLELAPIEDEPSKKKVKKVTKNKGVIIDDETTIPMSVFRTWNEDFFDTVLSPAAAFRKKQQQEPEISLVPKWFPKKSTLRDIFKKKQENSGVDSDPFVVHRGSPLWRYDGSPLARSRSGMPPSPGHTSVRRTPERDTASLLPFEALNSNPLIELSQIEEPRNELHNLGFPGLPISPDHNNLLLGVPIHEISDYDSGSRSTKSAKDRLIKALINEQEPVVFSDIFPTTHTSRRIAAAAFQGVLELLKARKITVCQNKPYSAITISATK